MFQCGNPKLEKAAWKTQMIDPCVCVLERTRALVLSHFEGWIEPDEPIKHRHVHPSGHIPGNIQTDDPLSMFQVSCLLDESQ